MATVNRYYSPVRSQYISQYVPQKLPVELMLAKLGQKDKMQQDRVDTINKFKEWTMDALPNYDTEYIEKEKGRIREFTDSMMTKDLTTPQAYNEYLDFARKFSDDPNKKKVQQSYDTHQKFLETKQKVETGNADQWEKDFVYDYQKYYDLYTKKTSEGGKGFSGEYQIGNPNIEQAVNRQKYREEMFDHLRADAGESAVRDAAGYYYKSGLEKLGDTKVGQAAIKQFDTYYTGAAGRMDQTKYDVAYAQSVDPTMPFAEIYKSMSDSEKKAYNEKKYKAIFEDVLKTGETFEYQKSSTTQHEAKNLGLEDQKKATSNTPLIVPGLTGQGATNDWKTDRGFLKESQATLKGLNSDIELLKRIQAGDTKNLTNEQINMLAGAIDPNDVRLAGSIKANGISQEQLDAIIKNKQSQISGIQQNTKTIEDKIANAMNDKFGKSYNGKSYSEIINSAQGLRNKYSNLYQTVEDAATSGDSHQIDRLGVYVSKLPKDQQAAAMEFIAYHKAKKDYSKNIDSPFLAKAYSNQEGSYQPQAVAAPTQDKIAGWIYTDQGPVFSNNIYTSEKQVENIMNTNPSVLSITVGGKKVSPVGKDAVKIASTNIPRGGIKGDKVTFNVKVHTGKMRKVQSGVDDEGNPKYRYEPEYEEGTATMSKSNYDAVKVKEYEAGINPNDIISTKFDGQNNYMQLNPNTTNTASIANWRQKMYIDHKDFYNDMQDINKMEPGDTKLLTWQVKDKYGRVTSTHKVGVNKTDDVNSPNRFYITLPGEGKNDVIEIGNIDELEIKLGNYKNQLQFE